VSPVPSGFKRRLDSKWMFKPEVAAFLYAARNVERDERAYYLFALMYLLGLRQGEALLLEWDHLGPAGPDGAPAYVEIPTLKQRVYQLEGLSPKERREASEAGALKRTMPVPILSHPRLVVAAFDKKRQPKDHRRVRSPWVFPGVEPGEHMSKSHAHRLFTLCIGAARLGGRGLTPHAFRHTAATYLSGAGASETTVQRFLRHTSRSVTQGYIHALPEEWARFKARTGEDGARVAGALDLPPLRPLAR